MANYPERLLAQPADEAARLIALAQLDGARAARRRLADLDDGEALHDFRVALRRLRSTIRSLRPHLEARVPRKWRRRLRDLARATTDARDAEVQIAWIRERRNELPRGRRAGLPWLLAGLAARRDRVYDEIRRDTASEFDRLDVRLRRSLTTARALRPAAPAFGDVLSGLVREHATELARELGLVRSAEDQAESHAARIQTKRLRYLLEPLAGDLPQVAAIVDRLKRLQDVLGELHDVHVLIGGLGDAVAGAAAERARRLHDLALRGEAPEPSRGPRRPRPASPGLLALARLAADWQGRLFQRLLAEWLSGELAVLLKDLDALADALAIAPPPRPAVTGRPAHKRVPSRRATARR